MQRRLSALAHFAGACSLLLMATFAGGGCVCGIRPGTSFESLPPPTFSLALSKERRRQPQPTEPDEPESTLAQPPRLPNYHCGSRRCGRATWSHRRCARTPPASARARSRPRTPAGAPRGRACQKSGRQPRQRRPSAAHGCARPTTGGWPTRPAVPSGVATRRTRQTCGRQRCVGQWKDVVQTHMHARVVPEGTNEDRQTRRCER